MKKGGIYLIESRNRQELASIFIRFQEYYESPEFKGKTFTIQEFTRWYIFQYGSFTYDRDWYGFNIPASVLKPFRAGEFDPLTASEKKLLDFCKKAGEDSYIIGATTSAEYFEETVKHEFLHGVFHVNLDYRKEVTNYLSENKVAEVYNALSDMGYHNDAALDEINAYLVVEPETMEDYISVNNTNKTRENLKKIFAKHFGFSITEERLSVLLGRVEHVLA